MNPNPRKRITLIELIVVISLIGVLLSIAIPQYQNHVVQTRVTESLILAAAGAKKVVAEKLASPPGRTVAAYSGTGPAGAESFGFQFRPTKDVASVAIAGIGASPAPGDGRISITFSSSFPAPGLVVRLTPGAGAAGMPLVWACDVNAVQAVFKYAPAECRS